MAARTHMGDTRVAQALDATGDALLDLVREDHDLYRGRGTGEVEGLRAHIVARVVRAGRADPLVPWALEALGTEQSPALLAAAAMVLQAAHDVPVASSPCLTRALAVLKARDVLVDLTQYPAPPGQGTSARALVLAAKDRLASAVCCSAVPSSLKDDRAGPALTTLAEIELETHAGEQITFGTLFGDKVSLLSFFYTRCMNPHKCSTTVSLLGALRRRLDAGPAGILVAGMSYDPEYDTPARLAAYARERALPVGPSFLLLRTREPFTQCIEQLRLGVGYGPVTVNTHRIEWLVVGPDLRIAHSGERVHWETEYMADVLIRLRASKAES